MFLPLVVDKASMAHCNEVTQIYGMVHIGQGQMMFAPFCDGATVHLCGASLQLP